VSIQEKYATLTAMNKLIVAAAIEALLKGQREEEQT